ncbi:transporter substrate-binding domain-containing protein [Rhodococcus sp. IEGM 1379]|uniref:transporter substrate-binding domain-containing protein n=1 Tax=Rhodococcus sp. IEGM 1379 TaxID=3047086 RepID=UPI0024B67426|nr:transporter substrate-binding domain-containing protein [Rhodococcus sp. IEGM 1379]MDI9914186.1 transporter substrate-binding domain-containing protein [Rhodococcus sp. IEGM 1379]
MTTTTQRYRRIATGLSVMAVVTALTACSAPVDSRSASAATDDQSTLPQDQEPIIPAKVDAIAAEVPATVRERGTLINAIGAAPNGAPPLAFVGADNKTLVGLDPDIAALVAGVLGLKLEIVNTSYENLFLGLASGKYDSSIGNITITPARLESYDMGSYRKDLASFEVKKDSGLRITTPEEASGKVIATKAATTQDKLLQQWNVDLAAKGLAPIDIKYFATSAASLLALQSGAVDAYLTVGATAAHESALPDSKIEVGGQPANVNPGIIGTVSMRGNGMAKPMCDAINHVIDNGDYAKVMSRWNMSDSTIEKCVVNTPTS